MDTMHQHTATQQQGEPKLGCLTETKEKAVEVLLTYDHHRLKKGEARSSRRPVSDANALGVQREK